MSLILRMEAYLMFSLIDVSPLHPNTYCTMHNNGTKMHPRNCYTGVRWNRYVILLLTSALWLDAKGKKGRCKNSLGNGPKKFENRTWTGTQTRAAGASLEFIR